MTHGDELYWGESCFHSLTPGHCGAVLQKMWGCLPIFGPPCPMINDQGLRNNNYRWPGELCLLGFRPWGAYFCHYRFPDLIIWIIRNGFITKHNVKVATSLGEGEGWITSVNPIHRRQQETLGNKIEIVKRNILFLTLLNRISNMFEWIHSILQRHKPQMLSGCCVRISYCSAGLELGMGIRVQWKWLWPFLVSSANCILFGSKTQDTFSDKNKTGPIATNGPAFWLYLWQWHYQVWPSECMTPV